MTAPPPCHTRVAQQPASPGSVGVTRTEYIDLPEPLALECGRSLHPIRIAYETYGTLSPRRDNVILVCHALSGDAHAAGYSSEPDAPSARDGFGAEDQGIAPRGGLGWWDGMIGPGKAFDTDRYFVVCTNVIGGCRGSTGPASINPATQRPYGSSFPVVTVNDMVRAQQLALHQLGIERLLAVTGGSLGGMQALEWTIAFPERVASCISIASTARLGSQGLAWNAIARNAITADPNWQGGDYYGSGRAPQAGIAVARQLGHVTYLSAEAMRQKFDRRLQERSSYSYTLDAADFAVESYLRYQGRQFAARFDANTYLHLSRALTYFDLAHSYGGSLERAFANTRARYLLITFSSDWLYPPSDSQEIEAALRANNKPVEHHTLQTSYGHDSFLLEEARQTPLIVEFLERVYAEVQARAEWSDQ
ncbi:MAG: homoserine O-acetyltransferase [Chloroflexi bacterium]|nr:MAG: homoserine O-acetyltransferase [Chloroflexota bacterium]